MLPSTFKTSLKIMVSSPLWLTGCRRQDSRGKDLGLVCFITSRCIILNHSYAAKGNVKTIMLIGLSRDGKLVKQAKAVILTSKWAELSMTHLFWMSAHHEFTNMTWEQRDQSRYLLINIFERQGSSFNSQQSTFSLMSNLFFKMASTPHRPPCLHRLSHSATSADYC